ncbi:MAG TPA: hypothetical protein VE548_12825 [Nitrososphaeraceae archaeon]|jgi:hypothetical protein|nr:hypothetical protein [Nitrososphaeraceae archaeon]
MSESQIQGHFKCSISIEIEGTSYESIQYLPDSLVVRFDRKKEQTDDEGVQKHSTESTNTNNKVLNAELKLDRKLKLFIDIFNALAGDDKNDVKKEILIEELVNTSKFTEDEAIVYVKKAQQYGFIYERKIDMYAIA